MARPDFPKSVMEFQRRFATDEACLEYLIESRWSEGFACPRCGRKEHYWKAPRRLFECKGCGRQSSVTAGTVMHRSKQPLHLWFWGAYLVTTHTPGMSALQFARQTGISTYETAFMMLHKLRAAMVREGRDRLHGIVEADESYVGGREAGPGGRGARGKAIVAAVVEVRKDDNGRAFAGRLRLCLIPNVMGETLVKFISDTVEPGTVVRTDGWAGYNGIKALGYRHEPVVEGAPEKVLPHVHRVFSNLKSWLIGTHHGVSKQHLQAYLNEYVFRFNRRRTPMAAFQTVLGLIAERVGPTYDGIYGVAKVGRRGGTRQCNCYGWWL